MFNIIPAAEPELLEPGIQTALRTGALREIARRTRVGSLVYFAMIVLICFATPYLSDHPQLVQTIGVTFLVLGLLRLQGAQRVVRSTGHVAPAPARWLMIWPVVMATAWGVFLAFTVAYYGTAWTASFIFVSSTALIAGLSTALAPILPLAISSMALVLLPSLLYLAVHFPDDKSIAMAAGSIFYLIFQISQARSNSSAFWVISFAAERERLHGSALIRKRDERNQALLRAVPDLILSMDRDGNVLDYKPAVGGHVSPLPEPLAGGNIGDVMPAMVANQFRDHIAQAVGTGEIQEFRYEIRSTERLVRYFHARMSVSPDQQVLAVIQEVTGQVNLEAELRDAQKLESAGRLAGGIAHDFNNLLTVINGYAELAIPEVTPNSVPARHLNEVLKAGRRAAQLTRRLLTFSRKELTEFHAFDLNGLVRESLDMFQGLLGPNVRLTAALEPELHKIMADSGQMHQVLMNLVINAGNAMKGGGSLTIATSNLEFTAATREARARDLQLPHSVPAGHYVCMRVMDTGSGMDEKTRERIFEPFFTTSQGKGLGLGLATVYGIVKQHGGWIWVESAPGAGAAFSILLSRAAVATEPAAVIAATAVNTAPGNKPPESKRGATILLAEDEETVRHLIASFLENDGFQVLQAGNGTEALAIADRNAGRIDLLLTDAIMPHMNGRELAERVAAKWPRIPVLFMSGYSENVITQSDVTGGANFIAKPFTATALRNRISETLGRPAAQD